MKILIGVLVLMMLMLGPQVFACDKGGESSGGGSGASSGSSSSGGTSGGASDGTSSGGASASSDIGAGASASGGEADGSWGMAEIGGLYKLGILTLTAPRRNQKCYSLFGTRFEMCVE